MEELQFLTVNIAHASITIILLQILVFFYTGSDLGEIQKKSMENGNDQLSLPPTGAALYIPYAYFFDGKGVGFSCS